MRIPVSAVLLGIMATTICRPAEVDLYTNSTNVVSYCLFEHAQYAHVVEQPTGGPNGTKCMAFSYPPGDNFYGTFGIKGLDPSGDACGGAALDFSGHNTLSFEAKGNIHDLQILCVGYTGAVDLPSPSATAWTVYNVPLNRYTGSLSSIDNVQFNMDGPGGQPTAQLYFCNVMLDPATSVRPLTGKSADPSATHPMFAKAGVAMVSVYGINGSLIASYKVNVAVNTVVADVIERNSAVGAHIAVVKGAGITVTQKIVR